MALSVQTLARSEIIRKILEVVNHNAANQIVDLRFEETGVLTFIAHGGDELPVDLSAFLFLRSEAAPLLNPTPATEEEAGPLRISTEPEAKEGLDDTTAMSPLKVDQVLAARKIPTFEFEDEESGYYLTLFVDAEDKVTIVSVAPRTFDQVAKTGNADQKGKTSQVMRLLGGLFLDKIPETTQNFPVLCIDPASGQIYKKAGGGGSLPAPTVAIVAHYEVVDAPRTETSREITGDGQINVEQLEQYQLIVHFSDNSTENRTNQADWNFYVDSFEAGDEDYENRSGQFTLVRGVVVTPGHTGIVRAVEGGKQTDKLVEVIMPVDLPILIQGSVDVNSCDSPDQSALVTGWAADKNHPNVAQTVVLYKDGQEYARQTCQGQRTDVRDELRRQGIATDATTFGFRFVKGADARDGVAHDWTVRVAGSTVDFTYNANPIVTCGTPPTPAPYIMDYEPGGPVAINEGGAAGTYFLTAVYNDGSRERYAGGAITQVTNVPGLTRTTIGNGSECTLQLAAGTITFNQNVYLEFVLAGGLRRLMLVQLINANDTRPSGLTTYKASFNFTRNNATRKYTTLDDANLTACKHFANIEAGNLNLFEFQAANLNDGTVCYLGTGTNTAVLSNEIYYITDASGNDTVKRAIQIVNGKIQVSKVNPSTCATPPPPPPARTVFITKVQVRRGFQQGEESISNPGQVDIRVIAINGRTPEFWSSIDNGLNTGATQHNVYPTGFNTLIARAGIQPYTHYVTNSVNPGANAAGPFLFSVGALSSDLDQINFTLNNIDTVDTQWTTVYLAP